MKAQKIDNIWCDEFGMRLAICKMGEGDNACSYVDFTAERFDHDAPCYVGTTSCDRGHSWFLPICQFHRNLTDSGQFPCVVCRSEDVESYLHFREAIDDGSL